MGYTWQRFRGKHGSGSDPKRGVAKHVRVLHRNIRLYIVLGRACRDSEHALCSNIRIDDRVALSLGNEPIYRETSTLDCDSKELDGLVYGPSCRCVRSLFVNLNTRSCS